MKISSLLTGSAIALCVSLPAAAGPMGTFGFVAVGPIAVNNGALTSPMPGQDITLISDWKLYPPTIIVNAADANDLGIAIGDAVQMLPSLQLIPHGVGMWEVPPTAEAIGVDGLHVDILSGRTIDREATMPGQAGGFDEQFVGDLAGIPVDISESCTQAASGAVINCSDSVLVTPGAIDEPSTLATLGGLLLAFVLVRRGWRGRLDAAV